MYHVLLLSLPVAGLDATASMELLYHLDLLAKSGRTVILTIHQPRMEIFHMFDRLVLLSDGKVSRLIEYLHYLELFVTRSPIMGPRRKLMKSL